MSRIRTIKPEFFTSEDIVDLTPLTRLFYISLWCEADREGRLNWKPKTLKLRYFPGDEKADFELSVNELLASNLINIYEVEGKDYAEIPRFCDHQVINNRESDSIIPKRPENSTREHASVTRESGVKVAFKGKGREGKGKEGKGREDASSRKTPLSKGFKITDQMREFFDSKNYPFSIESATDQWLNYCRREGCKYVDWYAAWQNGMAKQFEWWKRDNPGSGNNQVDHNDFFARAV